MSLSKTPIPLCRSAYLQDLTIALGRRSLKSLRKAHRILKFEVMDEEVDGVAYERLDIEAQDGLGRMTKIVLWEDAVCWVYSRVRIGKPKRHPEFALHASLAGMNAEVVAELIRATLKDFDSVQQTWKAHEISTHCRSSLHAND